MALMPSIRSGSRTVSLLASDSTLGLWIEGMRLRPRLGLLVESLEVALELRPICTPNPTAAKLDSRKVSGSNKRVDLRHADVQVRRNVLEGQEPGLDPCTFSRSLGLTFRTIALRPPRFLYLSQFGSVWAAKPRLEGGVSGRCCDEASRSSILGQREDGPGAHPLLLGAARRSAHDRGCPINRSPLDHGPDLPQDHILGSDDLSWSRRVSRPPFSHALRPGGAGARGGHPDPGRRSRRADCC